jgi:N-acetyl-gamma-glutamyl-phosphate reductase
MSRGILATCTAKAKPGLSPGALRQAYETAYADEPFVHLLPAGQWPATAMTLGANTALVQVACDERAGRIVAVRGRGPATARWLARRGFGLDAVEAALGSDDV